jgi:hypothetical protein
MKRGSASAGLLGLNRSSRGKPCHAHDRSVTGMDTLNDVVQLFVVLSAVAVIFAVMAGVRGRLIAAFVLVAAITGLWIGFLLWVLLR